MTSRLQIIVNIEDQDDTAGTTRGFIVPTSTDPHSDLELEAIDHIDIDSTEDETLWNRNLRSAAAAAGYAITGEPTRNGATVTAPITRIPPNGTANFDTPDQATFVAGIFAGNNFNIETEGTAVTLDQTALAFLASTQTPDDDGHYDGHAIWVGGDPYPVHPPAVIQLADELDSLAARIGAVLGTDLQLALTRRVQERATHLAAQLSHGDEPDATAADLLGLLWPDDPPLDWWRTPLGLLIAPTAAREPDAPGWSINEAAKVLGVQPGTVKALTNQGKLPKAADGHLSRSAVLARLVRLHGQARTEVVS